jgi:hypothetical protein
MEFRYALLHKSAGYWLVLTFFALANIWSWLRHRLSVSECCDQLTSVGFPFPFQVSGGITGQPDFLVTGMLLDIAIAWTLAILVAWAALLVRGATAQSEDQ